MSFRSIEDEKKDIDTLEKILDSLNTTSQVKPELKDYLNTVSNRLKELTRDYYAAILYLFTSPLSLHQRLILMQLATLYPKGSSGIELARSLGISEKSKSIYRDLKYLRTQNLVSTEDIHPRLKLVYANAENRFMNRLVELVTIHGSELNEIIKEK